MLSVLHMFFHLQTHTQKHELSTIIVPLLWETDGVEETDGLDIKIVGWWWLSSSECARELEETRSYKRDYEEWIPQD